MELYVLVFASVSVLIYRVLSGLGEKWPSREVGSWLHQQWVSELWRMAAMLP